MRKPLLIARQGRRPSGLLGQLVARIMAKETVAENDVALSLLEIEPNDAILEVGCGHGETLAKAAIAAPAGRLAGVDFSWVMHRHAMARHRRLVREGRLEFRFGNSDQLPFDEASFDKALAVHTIYFWSAPLKHLREIRRVLRPGGRLVLGFRPAEDPGFRAAYPAEVYHIRTEAEVAGLVREAGFEAVDVVSRDLGARGRISYATARARAVGAKAA
jgi:ubiquinone/menaquinone biosynthesis C-methylase UbiE